MRRGHYHHSNPSMGELGAHRRHQKVLIRHGNKESSKRKVVLGITVASFAVLLLHSLKNLSNRVLLHTDCHEMPLGSAAANDEHATPLIVSDMTTGLKRVSTQMDQLNIHEATGIGSKRPVLIKGWTPPADLASQAQFLHKYGNLSVYIKDSTVQIRSEDCHLPYNMLWNKMNKEILAFTNNKENPQLFESLTFEAPDIVRHVNSFSILSTMQTGQSHSFHRHGESWFGLATGIKVWWFLPPTAKPPVRVNACEYLAGATPPGATVGVQTAGTMVWFPKDWYHATCALDAWTVGVGQQQGRLIRQQFKSLPVHQPVSESQADEIWSKCTQQQQQDDESWKWYQGNLNQYYNDLEKDHDRNPNNPAAYAVHRWMGPTKSTLVHYELIHEAIQRHVGASQSLQVLDAGCGLGSALMWLEQNEPHWQLHGRTISEEQYKFIQNKLPHHQFQVELASYNELDSMYNVIFSIEALIHTTNMTETIKVWAQHLENDNNGAIVVIDDFLMPGTDRSEPDVVNFIQSWLANSLVTVVELHGMARQFGLDLVESRDLTAEYRIVELNYRNSLPKLRPDRNKIHQGWMGAKYRQKLTVEGKLGYHMLVFQKGRKTQECKTVPSLANTDFRAIIPKKECISWWYCCGKGTQLWDAMNAQQTDNTRFLKLDRSIFGSYMDVFAKHLNEFYANLPADYKGRFLDIGATGSTASGMRQVTSKFKHFAGPLEYWMLDSDVGAKSLPQTVHCDVCDCPQADTCGFDVTFSHTVLEHASRPERAFDTIARITKKGGLTMHLVPWSYQYHATPDDFYRFSHSALKTLLEDRGFEVLKVGFDLCSKRQQAMKVIDEHFDTIWLTYVVGRKK